MMIIKLIQKQNVKNMKIYILLGLLMVINSACTTGNKSAITSGDLTLHINNQLHTKVVYEGAEKPLMDKFYPSELITLNGEVLGDFELSDSKVESVNDNLGKGRKLIITGNSKNPNFEIQKKIIATVYDKFPNLITTRAEYINMGETEFKLGGWENNRYVINSLEEDTKEGFWSFQSASYPSRQDWILPLGRDFEQKNYQGMNASDYGGGTPVIDIWRPDAGLAIGHLELEPQLISLPVQTKGQNGEAVMSVKFDADSVSQIKLPRIIDPGDSVTTFETFVSAHTGDYFTSLKTYRKIMSLKGLEVSEPSETAYEPIWCAWGYGRDFTVDKVINTLPKVKELGFEWAVLDDGWQIAEGDWRTNDKFSQTTMKEFVDIIHDHGLKAKLWWAPLAADPGSRVHEEQSEMLLVNKQGNYQEITWWNSHYLNPALSSTKEYHKQLVKLFLDDWGFDGLKIDGQHLNQVPPDYGDNNGQSYPEKSLEELPDLYKDIYNTALGIKSEAVVEICPCGASGSSFIMPYMNQSVSSDPLSSWQIRHKGKTYKALMGGDAAYYGDHVELSDNQNDFASTVGIGGVIGTKFTWPEYSDTNNEFLLTSEKEALIRKWMDIYNENMLPKGNYRGELYDLGFDYPEGHAIEKDGNMYYAFYADSFDGTLELRGLDKNLVYQLINYETDEIIGEINGDNLPIEVQFKDHIMIKAQPKS